MYLKKILLAIAAVVIAVVVATPASAAEYDYQNGFFDNNDYSTTCGQPIFNNSIAPPSITAMGTCRITFKKTDLYSMFINYAAIEKVSDSKLLVKFYSDNVLKKTNTFSNKQDVNAYYSLSLTDIDKIEIEFTGNSVLTAISFYEIEIFDKVYPAKLKDLAATQIDKTDTVQVTYTAHTSATAFSSYEYLLDGEVVGSSSSVATKSYDFKNVTEGTHSFTVRTVYTDGSSTDASIDLAVVLPPPTDVKDLAVELKGKSILLTYTLPDNFTDLEIWRDNKLVIDNYKLDSFTDASALVDGKTYTYKVIAVAYNKKTDGSVVNIRYVAPPLSKDVASLKATATSNSVTLKWQNPKIDNIDNITIYRKNNTVAANVRALFSAGDGYTKLHSGKVETYTDNSVEPDTSYKYKITTTIAGVESDGVTVDVKTKPVTLDDTTLEQQPNGDYVVTWGAPTTGKMQINVGGTKYAVVPAANKTFTIPAADVKFNALGFADVQLVPLNDAEQPVGPSTKPGGGGLGSIIGGEGIFDAPDLVKAAASLLALVGGFILLGLAFRVVPMLVKNIRNAFISRGAKR